MTRETRRYIVTVAQTQLLEIPVYADSEANAKVLAVGRWALGGNTGRWEIEAGLSVAAQSVRLDTEVAADE